MWEPLILKGTGSCCGVPDKHLLREGCPHAGQRAPHLRAGGRPFPGNFSAAPFNLLENRPREGWDLPRVIWPLEWGQGPARSGGHQLGQLPSFLGTVGALHTPSGPGAQAPHPQATPQTPALSSPLRPSRRPGRVPGGAQAGRPGRAGSSKKNQSQGAKSWRRLDRGTRGPGSSCSGPIPGVSVRETEAWPSTELIAAR